MANRAIIAGLCVLLCLGTASTGCKKGCSGCRSYGSNLAGLNPYAAQVCYGNFCSCPNGLEGDSCQIYSFNKYFQPSSTWQVSDNCSGSGTYYVSMSSSSNYPYTVFYINGLFNLGTYVEADILSSPNNTSTTLNIPSQTIAGNTFYGQGIYTVVSNGPPQIGKITLNIDYTNSAGVEFPCTVYLYQQ